MKFEELKQSLKTNIETSYLIRGVDEYLLASAVNLIVKYSEIELPDLNLIKFNEPPIDCENVVRALDTMPIFSKKKLVYLDARMLKKTALVAVRVPATVKPPVAVATVKPLALVSRCRRFSKAVNFRWFVVFRNAVSTIKFSPTSSKASL